MSKSVLKGIAVATAVTLGAVSFAASAEAGGRHHYRHHHKHGGGAAVAAAILGFGLAAALSSRPHYYEPSYYSYGYAPYAYAPPPRRYSPWAAKPGGASPPANCACGSAGPIGWRPLWPPWGC